MLKILIPLLQCHKNEKDGLFSSYYHWKQYLVLRKCLCNDSKYNLQKRNSFKQEFSATKVDASVFLDIKGILLLDFPDHEDC